MICSRLRDRCNRGRLATMLGALALQGPGRACALERSDAEERFLRMRLEHASLADAVSVWLSGTDALLPLGQVCRLLEFAVQVRAGAGRADGFILHEDRRFSLDLRQGVVQVGQDRFDVRREDVLIDEDDLFVPARLLSKWLPVDFNIDVHAAQVDVLPREELPAQARAARARALTAEHAAPEFRVIDSPFQWMEAPFVDPSMTLLVATAPGRPLGVTSRWTARAAGDLLRTSASVYVAGDSTRPLSEVRVVAGRQDARGNLLGPAHATEALVGSVSAPPLPLVARPQLVWGGAITRSFQQGGGRLEHTFVGDLPEGWDLELYQDGVLAAYQPETPTHRYRIVDVPLHAGVNEFTLRFRGPQGREREERQALWADAGAMAAGSVWYASGAGWNLDGRPHAVASADVGLGHGWFATLGGATLPTSPQVRTYGYTGVGGTVDRVLLRGGAAASTDGGLVGEVAGQTRLGPVNVTLRHAWLDGFDSDIFQPGGSPMVSRSEGRVHATKALWPGVTVTANPLLVSDTLQDGNHRGRVAGPCMVTWHDLSMGYQLAWHWDDGGSRFAQHSLQLAQRGRILGIRGESTWVGTRLQSLAAAADWRWSSVQGLHATIQYVSLGDDVHIHLDLTRKLGVALLSFGASGSRLTGGTAELSISAGWGPAGSARPARFGARPVSSGGAAEVRVFLDENGNGVADAGERLLSGVRVTTGSGQALTGDDGIAHLTDLAPWQPVDVALAADTLAAPSWMAPVPGVRFVARRGHVFATDLPVIATGQVEGTATIADGCVEVPADGLRLQLVDGAGQVVAETVAAFDGLYVLDRVPPGRYLLRVNALDVTQRQLRPDGARAVLLTPQSLEVEGADLHLLTAADDGSCRAAPTSSAGAAPAPREDGLVAAAAAEHVVTADDRAHARAHDKPKSRMAASSKGIARGVIVHRFARHAQTRRLDMIYQLLQRARQATVELWRALTKRMI